MRKVADKIEYSPTAIYVHFADKNELFQELCHQILGGLRSLPKFRDVTRAHRAAETDRPNLHQFRMHYPNHYKFMFMTPHPPHGPTDEDEEMIGNPEIDAYAFLKVGKVQQA